MTACQETCLSIDSVRKFICVNSHIDQPELSCLLFFLKHVPALAHIILWGSYKIKALIKWYELFISRLSSTQVKKF